MLTNIFVQIQRRELDEEIWVDMEVYGRLLYSFLPETVVGNYMKSYYRRNA